MSTRQLRLTSETEIRKHAARLVNSNIHLVLVDKTAVLGKLNAANSTGIVVENMRLKKIYYSYNRIAEIYSDTTI
ncbi:MAG TPA: hypothetical protein VD884_20710 [Ohtaekwangia sp.]|nr:hypothetical protein [Ohtaekwangia sp.]